MKKPAGYSMLFGAALLCVLLLNADTARGKLILTSQTESERVYQTIDDTTNEVIETKTVTTTKDSNGNKTIRTVIKDKNGNITKDDTKTETASDSGTSGGESESAKEYTLPDSVPMNLGIKENEFSMPANFRGGNPDDDLIHVLEDVRYEKHEHTIIYEGDSSNLTDDPDAFYSSDPNMKWTVKDKDGKILSEENTNVATNGGEFYSPGEYVIGNGGARQVESGGDKKTITAQQENGVLVHDITSPDLWLALSEEVDKDGKDAEALQQELVTKMKAEIVAPKDEANKDSRAGRAYTSSDMAKAYQDGESWMYNKSFMFIDEGIMSEEKDENERNLPPTKKVGRITTTGSMFNENGGNDYTSAKIPALLIDKKDYTWAVQLIPSNAECKTEADEKRNEKEERAIEKFPGIFVKKNVPFIVAAVTTDNGDKRESAKAVTVVIQDQSGNEVKMENGAYMFRTANYPRVDYPEQSVCTISATVKDADGNKTEFALPVYVLDSYSSYSIDSNK